MTFEQEHALANLKTIAIRLCNEAGFTQNAIKEASKAFDEEDIWSTGIVDFIGCAVTNLDRLYADLRKSVTEEEETL